MTLRIYNSLTRRKEEFTPIIPDRVGMYVCGVTVYDYSHIGHARVMVVFDVIYRWLKHLGYKVTYVRNFTDIDDKIIRRARELGISCGELTNRMIRAFHEDMEGLNCLMPSLEPRATEHMDAMIGMITRLLDQGYAYIAENGDVMFSVRRFAGYGKLSGKKIDELEAGARVEINEAKHDPLDFVLWKKAREGEPSWDSPWGRGRPGWHIECSAMSCKLLGETFDIHGGGMDLRFPHHENEIAQSEAANGRPFARVWVHNGFVNIHAEKMSKSLGNFFTIRQITEKYQPEVLRFFLLGTHYRSPLDFSDEALVSARHGLDRLYETKRRLSGVPETDNGESVFSGRFRQAMNDDFNTAEALAVLFDLCREINRHLDSGRDVAALAAEFRKLSGVLGLLQEDPDRWFHGKNEDVRRIEALIAARTEARKARDFQRADAIRKQLADMGILLEDGPGGTTWKRAS
jgi:cysteinyl-tRNA synthetase